MNSIQPAPDRPLTADEWIASPRRDRIVRSVSRRLALTAEDRNDLDQESAMLLWRKRGGPALLPQYVYRLVLNRAIDVFCRERSPCPPSPENGPPAELRAMLRAGIARLPALEQIVCRIVFLEGLSEREAATRLHIGRGALRKVEQRVLRQLAGRRKSPAARRPTPDARRPTPDARRPTMSLRLLRRHGFFEVSPYPIAA